MVNAIKEVLVDGEMLTDEEKQEAAANFNTSDQNSTLVEMIFLALMYLVKGDSIDLKSIAKGVNKQFRNGPQLDADTLELLHSVSHHSVDAFEQMVFKLGLSSSRELLTEFYHLLNLKQLKFNKICSKFYLNQEAMRDNFTLLVYLLFYMMQYEILVSDEYEEERKKVKQLSILREKVRGIMEDLKNLNGKSLEAHNSSPLFKYYYETPAPKEEKKKDSKEGGGQTQGISASRQASQANLDASMSQRSQQEDENSNEAKMKNFLKWIFPLQKRTPEKLAEDLPKIKEVQEAKETKNIVSLHQELWRQIVEMTGMRTIESALIFIRNSAFVLLRINRKVDQVDPNYIKCMKELAQFFDVSMENFELLIDAVTGNPLDIFKLQDKDYFEYNLRPDADPAAQEFRGTFDPARLGVLSQLLKGNKKSLTQICLRWYHQYLYNFYARDTISYYFVKDFKVESDFIDIVQSFTSLESQGSAMDSSSKKLKKEYDNKVQQYIIKCIRMSRLGPKKFNADDYKITSEFFGDENSQAPFKILPFKEVPNDQIILTGEILEKLIALKSLDKSVLMKITGEQDPKSKKQKIMKSFLQIHQSESVEPQAIIDFLVSFSEIGNLGQANRDPVKPNEDPQRRAFISLILLLNANNFQRICQGGKMNKQAMGRAVNKLLDLHPDHYNSLDDKELSQCIISLHENNYLQYVTPALMKPLSDKFEVQQAHAAIGLLLGYALDDKKMMRLSLMDIIKDSDLDRKAQEGLIAVLLGDIEVEDSIKIFAKLLDIDGQLLIDLIDLTSSETKNLPRILIDFLKSNSQREDNKTISSLLSLFKGDLSQVKFLTQKLQVENNKAIPVIAAALGKMSILSEFYSEVQQILDLNSQNSLRYLISLAHGQSDQIYQMASLKGQTFEIYEPELTEALFKITYVGKQIFLQRLSKQQLKIVSTMDGQLNQLTKKLCTVLDIGSDKTGSFTKSVKVLIRACWGDQAALGSIYKKLTKTKDVKSQWYIDTKTQQCKMNKRFKTEKEILDYIESMIREIINEDLKFQQLIEKTQKDVIKKLRSVILPALAVREDNKRKTGVMGMLGIGANVPDGQQQQQQEEEKKNEEAEKGSMVQQMRKAIMNKVRKQVSNDDIYKNAIGIIAKFNEYMNEEEKQTYTQALGQCRDDRQKAAFQVGCTYSLALNQRISQPYYQCLTCNEAMDVENLGICQVCAIFCHAGHNVEQVSQDLILKSVCNCGSGSFDECETLNDKNPIIEFQQCKECKVARNTLQYLQEKCYEDEEKREQEEKGNQVQDEKGDPTKYYNPDDFLIDLAKALGLTGYFENQANKLQEDLIKEGYIDKDKNSGIISLLDQESYETKSLPQNIILLANGNITQSFLTLLSVKKGYSIKDYQNHNPFSSKDERSSNYPIYITNNCLMNIAQQDFEKFAMNGSGMASVLGEIGTIESPAIDKLQTILILARGAELPEIEEDFDSAAAKKNRHIYVDLFKKFFGVKWKWMISLHKALTLSNTDLVQSLSLKFTDNSGEFIYSEEIQNIQNWIDNILFETALKFNESSTEFTKNMIGIISRFPSSLDYFAKLREISPLKTKILKALVFSSNQFELEVVFQKLSRNIPQKLCEQLNLICRVQENESILKFIMKFIEISKGKDDWSELENFELQTDENTKQNLKYLTNIYQLMSGDVTDLEKQLELVMQRYLKPSQDLKKLEPVDKEFMNTLVFINGIFGQDQQLSIKIAEVLQMPSLKVDILDSVVSILKNQQNSKDLKSIIKIIHGKEIGEQDNEIISDCKCLLSALLGDLTQITKLVDKLGNNDSHLRSFIASLITGQTKYDDPGKGNNKPEQIQMGKNILLREVFRVFEKAVRIHFEDTPQEEKIDTFLKKAFEDKVPLYLILMLTEDKNLMESLFDIQEHFTVSLKAAPNIQDTDKKFLKNFLDFLNPYNPDVSIKPMFRYLLNVNRTTQLQLPIFGPLESLDKSTKNFRVDLLDFLNQVFNCLTQDNPATAVTGLFETFLEKSLEQLPMFRAVLQILNGMMDGTDIFGELPELIKLIMQTMKVEIKDNKIIDFVSEWIHVGIILLSKEKKSLKTIPSILEKAVKATLEYLGDKPDNPLASKKDNLKFIVDSVIGLISLTKGDLTGIKPLAIKLGGFPTAIDKLEQFIKVIKQNKEGLNFKSVGGMVANNVGTIASALPIAIPGGEKTIGAVQDLINQAMEDPSKLLDPKNIFKFFANSKGTMGFEEFSTMLRQLGLPIPHAQMLQLFSLADVEKRGELTYQQFIQSIQNLKTVLINEVMAQLGFSIQDMAIAFGFSIVILILMFAFIFVGMGAFSPSSSFSSVTNSLLPLGAGASVNKKSDGEKKPEDLAKETQIAS